VAPGADYDVIGLTFDGVSRMRVDADGDLVLETKGGAEVRQHKPVVYQEVEGRRQQIASRYIVKGKRQVSFEIAQYDRTPPLVLGPVLVYSTFLGGGGAESPSGIAVDFFGNAYITGLTTSLNFPTVNALQPTIGRISQLPPPDIDVFITKLNSRGSALIFSTYLGGVDIDQSKDIAEDLLGNFYYVCESTSLIFT